jgi:hypothetical protein
MAERISARLSPGEARRFGLVVGAAFLMLGVIVWWRDRPLAGQVLGGIGGALIVVGIILPTALVPVHRAWMGLAILISKVTTPILLGIIYFGIITPTGLIRRMLGHDAVRSKATRSTFWVPRKAGREQPEMTHQF